MQKIFIEIRQTISSRFANDCHFLSLVEVVLSEMRVILSNNLYSFCLFSIYLNSNINAINLVFRARLRFLYN